MAADPATKLGPVPVLVTESLAQGVRRHEVDLAAEHRLFLVAVEMSFRAVALQAADRARVTSLGVAVGDLLDGEHEVGCEGCRVLSRLIATGRDRRHAGFFHEPKCTRGETMLGVLSTHRPRPVRPTAAVTLK
jgi:hypothetical protein